MTRFDATLPRVEKTGGGSLLPPATGRPQQVLPSAYSLFLLGKDTTEIAMALGISEAQALKSLNVQRSRSKGLPSPYGARR